MVVASQSSYNFFGQTIERGAALLEADPGLRKHMPIPEISARIAAPGMRSSQIIREVLTAYADRQALGERATAVVTDPRTGARTLSLLPEFRTISYAELDRRVQSLVAFWASEEASGMAPGRLLCLMGFASIDYVTADLACIYAGGASVPLQTTMYDEDLVRIIRETEAGCMVVGLEHIEKAMRTALDAGTVQCVVVMDYDERSSEQKARFDAARASLGEMGDPVRLIALNEILETCQPTAPIAPYVAPAGEDPLANIFYTSGSTGSPKGAMFPDSLWARWWSSPGLPIPMIQLCYQPMNHGMGRFAVVNSIKTGGICYFAARSDMSTLFEDAQLVRPVAFDFVPRVAELVYHQYNNEVARRLDAGAKPEADVRIAVMEEMRAKLLGGRVVSGIIGTAPTDAAVAQFIRECFLIPLVDAYGSTESGSLTFNGRINRDNVIDFKLREVPELGYYPTDKPYPRGELLVKTRSAVSGYFKNPELTAELFQDGYIAMGDIVEQREPDWLVWLDRRNNVQKLAQGEYVAISRVETILTGGDSLISNLYLYGNSKRAYTVAVVVPDLDVARSRLGREPGADDLRALIRMALNEVAQRENLRSYEVPRDFIVELEPFSNANGLLSSISKIIRPALKKRYGEALEALYTEHDRFQAEEFSQLRANASQQSVQDTLVSALKATLGITDIDVTGGQSFTDLGGDSLAAVSLSALLEEIFGISVPVGTILSPVVGIRGIADHIEMALRGDGALRASFASVHGESAEAGGIAAADLTLDRFIDADTLDKAALLPLQKGSPRTVLLTGASGFLGRFLCLEWLTRLAPLGGKLVCIIRAPNDDAARQRLTDALDSGDRVLNDRFADLSADRLEVLAGDLAAPKLGLDDATFARLAGEVDLIVHPAALVNHMLGYRQLFEPNVMGTAELIRLGLTTRRKRFDFVSTVAVAMAEDGTPLPEDGDVRITRSSFGLGDGYANGYSSSKWAGEVLLREAHQHFGMPVNVLRSDMILPHSEYAGQINAPDVFIRLLLSIVETGLAPQSFYRLDANGKRVRAHYDGLPVDFTARAIAAIGDSADDGYHSYNIVNHHDDGVSLDTIVDWIEDSGCEIMRVADYSDWIGRFEAALMRLPAERRPFTSLPVIDQLRRPMSGDEFATLSSQRFQAKVSDVRPGGSGDIPHVTQAFVEKCVRDVQGLMDKAPRLESAVA